MKVIRKKLLTWYDHAARDLPWRRTKDPYAIWVSEVMLQQTRVDTVIPYYQRFLARFPTPAALAVADEDAVLSLWSGLGYYRRARLLHRGVREVVAQYGGDVPEDAASRRALPGVGRYTAGAIGSIAFGREEPVVDGNVNRVLARLFRIDSPLGAAHTERVMWEKADALVRGDRPGALNQAIMELGATVCTPKQPACDRCPVQSQCQAHAAREVDAYPVPRVRKAPVVKRCVAVVAMRGRGDTREVWLTKGDRALFGGLWGVPMVALENIDSERHTSACARAALRGAGASGRLSTTQIGTVRHVLTHRDLHVDVYRATSAHGDTNEARRFFRPAELGEVGVARLTEKILAVPG